MNRESLKKKISRHLPKTAKKGSVPGAISYVGRVRNEPVKLHVIDYNQKEVIEKDLKSITEIVPFIEKESITWLDVSGVHDANLIEQIGCHFNIHPLILEDIANTTQRPKVEQHNDFLFLVLKMACFDTNKREIIIEHVSFIVGKNYLISFQEIEGDVLEDLRNRIRNNKGRARKLGSDYLMYAIFDSIVDNYFPILEEISEEIEGLEVKLVVDVDQEIINSIYKLKHEIIYLRKSIWPIREVINSLLRDNFKIIGDAGGPYFKDLYDHTVQIVETVEIFRDLTSSMLELHASQVSNRLNEIMKVLTMFAAIFIPLTFLAGVYGMNFEHMPELKTKFGYFVLWGIMVSIGSSMLYFFKKKKWF
jgi:magnesium transporter